MGATNSMYGRVECTSTERSARSSRQFLPEQKGRKLFAVFELEIEGLLLVHDAVAENRAGTQRTRPELHAALKPADSLA